MSIKQRFFSFVSIIVILAITINNLTLISVSAQSGDGIKRNFNAESGSVSFIGPESGQVLSAAPQGPATALAKRFVPEFGLGPSSTPTLTPTATPEGLETLEPEAPEFPVIQGQSTEQPDLAPQQAADLTGNTWYVVTTGDDSNSCSTTDAPCATINGVLAKTDFVANDKVKIASGTYTEGTYSGNVPVLANIEKSVILSGGWDFGFTTQTGFSTFDGENSRGGISIGDSDSGVVLTISIEYFILQNSNSDYLTE